MFCCGRGVPIRGRAQKGAPCAKGGAQCWNQEKTLLEIQNRVLKCVEHGMIAENVGKIVLFSRKNIKKNP